MTQWEDLDRDGKGLVYHALERMVANDANFAVRLCNRWRADYGDAERLKAHLSENPALWRQIEKYF